MRISDAEREAIVTVLRLSDQHGYGNLMNHMATAWAKVLMDRYGMDEESARAAALLPGYPFAMQADLIERGEWDETGEWYKGEPPDPPPPPKGWQAGYLGDIAGPGCDPDVP